jgi:hypothetical protein
MGSGEGRRCCRRPPPTGGQSHFPLERQRKKGQSRNGATAFCRSARHATGQTFGVGPERSGRCGLAVTALVAVSVSLLLASPGHAQGRSFYNITSIKAKQLKNAVILTIEADGAMTDAHSHDWMFLSGWTPRPVKEFELHCPSGKSKVGDFVDISVYPVSHVELEPRAWANDGIGVNLTINLYTEARVRHFHGTRLDDDWDWNPSQGCCFDGEIGRDKQSFVFTFVSDRFAPPTADGKPPSQQQLLFEPGPRDTYSLYALNLDLRRLVDELGRETGTRIMVDQSVECRVTVNLPEMTVAELLEGIAQGYGLALEERGGKYVFSKGLPINVATYETNVTQVVPLDHLSPEAALELLPNFLLAYVKPSDAQNALIVAGPPQLVEHVREDVARIDTAPQQIRVEVAAVKIASGDAWHSALSAEWAGSRRGFGIDPDEGQLFYRKLEQPVHQTHAVLRALDQAGVVDTLAKAHVTLVNGKWASLFLGQERYIQVTRNYSYGSEDVAVPVELGVDVGLMAWTGGKEIRLWLRPTVTALGGVDPRNDLPIVDRYETQSAIRVVDGHTVLLGGIKLRSAIGMDKRIRWVGGLIPPARTKTEEDIEVALFLTAEILGEFDQTGEAKVRSQLDRDLRREGLTLRFHPLDQAPDGDSAVSETVPPLPIETGE